ncbi:MAG: hypothetical protein V3V91_01125, partial [Thermoplasmata archaeon]
LNLAVSNADGTFMFDYATGTYDFDLVKGSDHVGEIDSALIEGSQTTDVGDIAISTPSELDLTWPLAIIILILVVVLLVLAIRGSRKEATEVGEGPESEEGKSPDE